MKVLVVTSSYPASGTGYQGRFVADLNRHLKKRGIDPVVLAPHFHGGSFRESKDGIRLFRFPYFLPLICERVAYGSGLPFNIRRDFFAFAGIFPFSLAEFIGTTILLLRERPGIIHTHWLLPQGLIGALFHRLTGIPHIVTVHGSDLNILKNNAFLRCLSGFVVCNSAVITVNSTYMKKQLTDIIPEAHSRIRCIPMGVEPAEFEVSGQIVIQKKIPVHSVLSVSRLIDWKGTKYLIEAIPRVLQKLPGTIFVIIGAGPEEKALKQQTHDLGIEKSVIFRGIVSDNDLITAYHDADVFVLPSINLAGKTEGLGVVLLEAMASGCPVIGSAVGGIPDIISDGQNGFLVPEREPAALADQIVRILSDQELGRKFRKNGLVTVHDSFSWDSVSARFATIYSEITKSTTMTAGRV